MNLQRLYWRKFWSQTWTKTHLVPGEARALCGEPVNHYESRTDEQCEVKNLCRRCLKAAEKIGEKL